jgi:hypothetical protein
MASGAAGTIVARGRRYGGFTLNIKSGTLIYESNINSYRVGKVVSSQPLPARKATVAVKFTPDSPVPNQSAVPAPASLVEGVITLSINGKPVGSGHVPCIGNNTDTLYGTVPSTASPNRVSPLD